MGCLPSDKGVRRRHCSWCLKLFHGKFPMTNVFMIDWQVPRAALALVVAPIADGVLIFLQARLRLRTRFNAFLLVVGLCLSLSAAIFGITLAVWA